MSTIKVSGNPTTNNNTLVVNFTTDASNISDILLSKDGGKNYISATSFTDTSAFFNINTWANGTVTITATSHSGVSKSIRLTVTNGTIR